MPQEYVPVSKMNYSKSFFFRQTLIFPNFIISFSAARMDFPLLS